MTYSRLIFVLWLVSTGCSESAPQSPDVQDAAVADAAVDLDLADGGSDLAADASPDAGAILPVQVEVLQVGQATVAEQPFTYQLARVTDRQSGHIAYVQWNTPVDMPATPHPVFVYTKPYVGIDWTGEAVDEKWAALGAGIHPDNDEPSYNVNAGNGISYQQTTPLQMVEEGAVPLLNKVPTLMIFGRFYAGGSIQDDLDDMVVGLRFLEDRADVAADRIAIVGGSWGGFEALHGAAYAPESVRPAYGVALYPLSDFSAEWTYTDSFESLTNLANKQMYTGFFEPYRRRIAATTGGGSNADFSGFTHADIAAKLKTPFVFMHDDQDTLVPFTMAQDLADTLKEQGQYLWFRHENTVDLNTATPSHGPTPGAYPISIFTLAYANVIPRLLPAEPLVILVGHSTEFGSMLVYLQAQEARGQGIGDFLKNLAAIADPRAQVFDLATNTFVAGPEFVTSSFNAAFGTTYTAANVQASLLAR